jgi:type II secretory pathway component PulK
MNRDSARKCDVAATPASRSRRSRESIGQDATKVNSTLRVDRDAGVAATRTRPRIRERGAILIIAMVILFAVVSLVLTMGRTTRTESMVSANEQAAIEASAIEAGAEQYVLGLLTEQRSTLNDLVEEDFAAVPVGTGYFWIIRPDWDDTTLPLYGLLDESSKLNLNPPATAYERTYEALRTLPRMTDEIAGSIIDWRDEDDAPMHGGAESSYYLGLPTPYRAKNAAYESVEELYLVKGITREIFEGVEASTTIGEASFGLADATTIWSSRPNTAADGTARTQINTNRPGLITLLREKLGDSRGNEVGLALGGQLTDVFELASRGKLQQSELELVEDYVTVIPTAAVLIGRINVNTAPREVLLTIPTLTSSDVDALLARRPAAVQAKPNSMAWVYDVLKEKSVGLAQYIWAEGSHYSADIVAVSGNGRAFNRVKIVVDVSGTTPRIVFRRDLSMRGFPLDRSILDDLRQGRGVAAMSGSPMGAGAR